MKIYFDYETLFKPTVDGIEAVYPITNSDDEIVVTGVSVTSMCGSGLLDRALKFLLKFFGVRLIENEADYVPEFYCVPHIEIFAYNKKGCFGFLNPTFEETNNIVHINLFKGKIKVYKSFITAIFDIKREKAASDFEFFRSKSDAYNKYNIK